MENACAPFEGKRITVLGLGLLGRGIGDVAFLAGCGAQVLVTDRKTETELAESVSRLQHLSGISFHLGGHRTEDFTSADFVLKAAGVRLDSPEIEAARSAGVPVVMSTALFAKHASAGGATIVGVTGTRGKSTVTNMIYHALTHTPPSQSAGRERKVFLGGNVRGISTLAMLPDVEAGDIAVLELDSWQLQGFGELGISPQVAVFTNLMPDHQNYYAGMQEYFSDKAHIFLHQKEGDVLVVQSGLLKRYEAKAPARLVNPASLPADWKLKIPGDHNRENAAHAHEALRALGLSEEEIRRSLESFEGVEGRLQYVGEVDGMGIYNDNNATTPEATIAALKALKTGSERSIVLIMGGADKGLAMNSLLKEIHTACKAVILLDGTGTEKFKQNIPEAHVFQSLAEAVKAALSAGVPGDTVLFSPAFASFGMFKNEYDRNDQFLSLIRERL